MKTHNELIAEFMGFKFHSDRESGNIRIYQVPEGQDLKFRAFKLAHVKFAYDTSWDWLMPVVEKITALKFRTEIHTYYIQSRVEIYGTKFDLKTVQGFEVEKDTPLITIVYKSVVQFIKWHNNSLT